MSRTNNHVDPALREHVFAVRNRFGVDGLREAQRLIAEQITVFENVYDDLASLGAEPTAQLQ